MVYSPKPRNQVRILIYRNWPIRRCPFILLFPGKGVRGTGREKASGKSTGGGRREGGKARFPRWREQGKMGKKLTTLRNIFQQKKHRGGNNNGRGENREYKVQETPRNSDGKSPRADPGIFDRGVPGFYRKCEVD